MLRVLGRRRCRQDDEATCSVHFAFLEFSNNLPGKALIKLHGALIAVGQSIQVHGIYPDYHCES